MLHRWRMNKDTGIDAIQVNQTFTSLILLKHPFMVEWENVSTLLLIFTRVDFPLIDFNGLERIDGNVTDC